MGAKILVVDDSLMVRKQVSFALVAAGFSVIEAVDGVDALQRVAESPDTELVICDVNMPRMNGLDFLEAMAKGPKTSGVPVVMLTTEGHLATIQRAKSLGAKGWILKPFRPDLLVAAVRKLTAVAA